MLLSSVVPLQGTDLANAIRVVKSEAEGLSNLSGTRADERLNNYHRWSSQAADQLRYVFDLEQVESLVMTRRHDFLIDRATAYNELLINTSVSAEQADRGRVFKELIDSFEKLQAAVETMPGLLLVPDTNVYLHHERYFDDIGWTGLAQTSAELRVMVPMAVVRELDKNKRAQGNKRVSETNDELVRTRARVSSRRLRNLFESPFGTPSLSDNVTVELILDPPGHRRIEDPDSEIIDRALAARTVSGRQVSIVTGDGNMQFAARVAGLDVVPVEI